MFSTKEEIDEYFEKIEKQISPASLEYSIEDFYEILNSLDLDLLKETDASKLGQYLNKLMLAPSNIN